MPFSNIRHWEAGSNIFVNCQLNRCRYYILHFYKLVQNTVQKVNSVILILKEVVG